MARFLAETAQSGFSLARQSGPGLVGENGFSFPLRKACRYYATHVRLSASQVSTRESSDMIILAGELAEYFCEKHRFVRGRWSGLNSRLNRFSFGSTNDNKSRA